MGLARRAARGPARGADDAHTGRHHHFYRSDAPTWDRPADIWLILFSPLDVVLLAAILLPLAVALRAWVAPGAWTLGTVTAIAYFLAYEAVHLACHLPSGSAIVRAPVVGVLRRRHLAHHRLAGMNRNFGVTNVLWDLLLRTEGSPD